MVTEQNLELKIYNSDGTSFNGLSLRKFTVESVVMSLSDKITGDVFYDGNLNLNMDEYVEYEGVRYTIVSPPTIVREGLVSASGSQKGLVKYSFTFYHPMCVLNNIPFSDVAVYSDQQEYLSENKIFSWLGNGFDLISKINKNLEGTEWFVVASANEDSQAKLGTIPEEILAFDHSFIADALKKFHEVWELPFVVGEISEGEYELPDGTDAYASDKRFVVTVGVPSNEIIGDDGEPFVFQFGQGVGLKNNSRTPRNNKIITRIAPYGSERNIPYGYPQVRWYGDPRWDFTEYQGDVIHYDANGKVTNLPKPGAYPIYRGILNGEYVQLIKHPFTRNHLMPNVYVETLFNKISPYLHDGEPNTSYDPDLTLVDYYDAVGGEYPNNINQAAPSFESHQFEEIYPRLGEKSITGAEPWDMTADSSYLTYAGWYDLINARVDALIRDGKSGYKLSLMVDLAHFTCQYTPQEAAENPSARINQYRRSLKTGSCKSEITVDVDDNWANISIVGTWYNESYRVLQPHGKINSEWDDSMDDDGNYEQPYFKMAIPMLDFDLYACASITEEMHIVMRSGACIGCTFPVDIDWEDYKANFFDHDGNFDPLTNRDFDKYPDSRLGSITLIVKKDIDTFGTLMPNVYQYPKSGDKFVITGISLPASYIGNAQEELDEAGKQYMLANNTHYFDYPLKFDEYFLAKNERVLSQLRNNTIIRFVFGDEGEKTLLVKQLTAKYGSSPLPQYDVVLTDEIEVVQNKIGSLTEDVTKMRNQLKDLEHYYSEQIIEAINSKLSKLVDDVALGKITFQQGLNSLSDSLFGGNVGSDDFQSALYGGKGWRVDKLGNAEFESLQVRSYLRVVELLVNRLQAQEGDTMFTDNDQIEKVDVKDVVIGGVSTRFYLLSFKEKWNGYTTSQKVDNILKGIINTMAAQDSGIIPSNIQGGEYGETRYFTSWMKVIDPESYGITAYKNQKLVMLYNDNEVPAGENFPPCELMTVARWGCDADPDAVGLTPSEKQDIIRRQSSYNISVSDGRVTKMTGVRSPILTEGNYGVVIGVLPEFVQRYQSVMERLETGRDYLYARGVVVKDFIKIDSNGNPVSSYVDMGEWAANTAYLHNSYNNTTLQYETHRVWHNGCLWECLTSQPYNGVYYEPTDSNPSMWRLVFEGGMDGKPAATLTPSIQVIGYAATDVGAAKSQQSFDVRFSMTVGNTQSNVNSLTYSTLPVGVSVTMLYTNVARIVIAAGTILPQGTTIEFSGVCSYAGENYPASCSISILSNRDGAQGPQGKRSRFNYYAGDWDSFADNAEFVISDVQAPYFSKTNPSNQSKTYWAWIGANGTHTDNKMLKSEMSTPSSSDTNWEIMTSDFKYLITEAIFAYNAKLGSAVFFGNWLISERGRVRTGVNTWAAESSDYTLFDPNDPNADTVNHFRPNLSINLYNGNIVLNDAIMNNSEMNSSYISDAYMDKITFGPKDRSSFLASIIPYGGADNDMLAINSNRTVFSGVTSGADNNSVTIDRYGNIVANGYRSTFARLNPHIFGSQFRTTAVVAGGTIYFYKEGIPSGSTACTLESISAGSDTVYLIPLHPCSLYNIGGYKSIYRDSDGNDFRGLDGYYVDTLLINGNISNGMKYMLCRDVYKELDTYYPLVGQNEGSIRVNVINTCDVSNKTFKIASNGSYVEWEPGEVAEVTMINSDLMQPAVSNNIIGAGVFVGAFRNNEWT